MAGSFRLLVAELQMPVKMYLNNTGACHRLSSWESLQTGIFIRYDIASLAVQPLSHLLGRECSGLPVPLLQMHEKV